MIELDIKVKLNKKLSLSFPNAGAVMGPLARRAAARLRHRVEVQGLDADGRLLPEVGGNRMVVTGGKGSNQHKRGELKAREHQVFFSVSAKDPRFKDIVDGMLRQGGFRLSPGGYREFKRRIGRHTRRGSSLTGAMWKALTAGAKAAKGGEYFVVKLYFAGGQKTPTGYLRHRVKAELCQYSKRAGATGGKPTAAPDFLLMRFSPAELEEFATFVASNIRLFEPA